MKRITIVFLMLCTIALNAQSILEMELQYTIGLTGNKVLALPDGDYFITANAIPASYDSSMALLIKTDSLLQPRWTKRFKLLNKDQFSAITSSMDGNFFLGGSGREDFNINSGGSLYKIDSSGTELWHMIYSDSYDDALIKIFEQPDSTLMLFIRKGVNNQPTKIILASKDGSIISQKYFQTSMVNLLAESVAADGMGNYLMSGTVTFGGGMPVLYIISMDQSTINWYKEYHFGRSVTNTAIEKLTDGKFAITGSIADSTFPNTSNVFVMKVDGNGDIDWTKEIMQSQAYNEYGNALGALPNGEICVSGQASTAAGFKAFACKLTSQGNISWAGTYGNYPYQDFTFIQPVADGKILFMGFTNTSKKLYLALSESTGQSPCSYAPLTLLSNDIFGAISAQVVATSIPSVNGYVGNSYITNETVSDSVFCSGMSGISELRNELQASVFPNPSNGPITLFVSSSKNEMVHITLINTLSGVQWTDEMKLSQGDNMRPINFDAPDPGLYFLMIKGDAGVIAKKIVFLGNN